MDLREEYLRNRGHDVVAAIQQQTRGPGRHNNPEIWQEAFEDAMVSASDTVEHISLLDSANRRLAHVGPAENAPDHPELYSFRIKLEMGRGRGWGMGAQSGRADWQIEIGMYSEPAEFIARQARLHAIVAGIGTMSLLGLAFYFVKTLNRFLALKNREESEKHLAALGAMSATLAHEIRNPLGAMKGLTQLVQEDLPDAHRSQELMGTVVSEAQRLEQLVTDLLTFARKQGSNCECLISSQRLRCDQTGMESVRYC
jgi:signal transduction histidine kinase